jgi:hypothetical protein
VWQTFPSIIQVWRGDRARVWEPRLKKDRKKAKERERERRENKGLYIAEHGSSNLFLSSFILYIILHISRILFLGGISFRPAPRL